MALATAGRVCLLMVRLLFEYYSGVLLMSGFTVRFVRSSFEHWFNKVFFNVVISLVCSFVRLLCFIIYESASNPAPL